MERNKRKKIRTFQLGDEPKIIYIIPHRFNEYILVHEDPYHLNNDNTEFLKGEEIKEKYKINLSEDIKQINILKT